MQGTWLTSQYLQAPSENFGICESKLFGRYGRKKYEEINGVIVKSEMKTIIGPTRIVIGVAQGQDLEAIHAQDQGQGGKATQDHFQDQGADLGLGHIKESETDHILDHTQGPGQDHHTVGQGHHIAGQGPGHLTVVGDMVEEGLVATMAEVHISNSNKSRSPMSNRKRHVGDRDAPPEGKCLGIFGLSLYTTEREVKEMCDRYGEVESCQIVYDHATGRSRGFSFVYFKDVDSAVEAKERLNGQELDGRRIRVDFSITQRPHTPTPGVYMGRPT
eukprot:gene14202-5212_t